MNSTRRKKKCLRLIVSNLRYPTRVVRKGPKGSEHKKRGHGVRKGEKKRHDLAHRMKKKGFTQCREGGGSLIGRTKNYKSRKTTPRLSWKRLVRVAKEKKRIVQQPKIVEKKKNKTCEKSEPRGKHHS